jgi:peptide deformylase
MKVTVRAQNREGNWCLYKGEGLKARAFCHELDHLDGVLFIDRLATEEQIKEFAAEEETE